MKNRGFLPLAFFLVIGSAGALNSAEPTCEAQRDRVQVRLEMAQGTLTQRETQLADLVVRFSQLEAELKTLKAKKTEPEKTE